MSLRHVPRARNKRADELCNEALDGRGKTTTSRRPPAPKPARAKATVRADQVREEAVNCLRAVAAEWARGNPNQPPPEAVWEQLWSILEENGVVLSPTR